MTEVPTQKPPGPDAGGGQVLNPIDRVTPVLFATGAGLARYTGRRPLREVLWFMASGAVLVAMTIALGG